MTRRTTERLLVVAAAALVVVAAHLVLEVELRGGYDQVVAP